MATVFEFPPNPPGSYTNGAAVVANASIYDAVAGTPTYDTGVRFKDLPASIKCASVSEVVTVEQTFPAAVSDRYMTRVLRCSAFTAGTFATVTRIRLGGTNLAEVRVTSGGDLLLRIGSTTVVTHPIAWNTPFRFEWDVVGSSMTFRVYESPAEETPTATYGPFAFTGGTFDRIVDGVGVASATETTFILYAADGDTANPGLSRWAAAGGLHKFAVRGGVLVPITARAVRGGALV